MSDTLEERIEKCLSSNVWIPFEQWKPEYLNTHLTWARGPSRHRRELTNLFKLIEANEVEALISSNAYVRAYMKWKLTTSERSYENRVDS
jgi:hypothetical protein